LKTIEDAGYPRPTHYYSGSAADAKWYTDEGMEIVIVDRFSGRFGNVSSSKIRESIILKTPYWKSQVPEVLHELVETKFPESLRHVDPNMVFAVKKEPEILASRL